MANELNLADLNEKSHASLTSVNPGDHHAKYTDNEVHALIKPYIIHRHTFIWFNQHIGNPIPIAYSDGTTWVKVGERLAYGNTAITRIAGAVPDGMTRRIRFLPIYADSVQTGETTCQWKIITNLEGVIKEITDFPTTWGSSAYRVIAYPTYFITSTNTDMWELWVLVRQETRALWIWGCHILIEDYYA